MSVKIFYKNHESPVTGVENNPLPHYTQNELKENGTTDGGLLVTVTTEGEDPHSCLYLHLRVQTSLPSNVNQD